MLQQELSLHALYGPRTRPVLFLARQGGAAVTATPIAESEMPSIAERLEGRPGGFTVLRLLLATGIVAFHSVTITAGNADAIAPLVMSAAQLILPAFFATSGFLVAASLARAGGALEFIALRLLRLAPGLVIVVLATMLILGPVMTRLDAGSYFGAPGFYGYLSNLIARPAYGLPGLFAANPRAGIVNGSLWTIPLELQCYLLLMSVGAMGLLRRAWAALLVMAGAAAIMAGVPLPGWSGLGLAFAAGASLFLWASAVPLRSGLALVALLLAYGLASEPALRALSGIPIAYACVWLGCQRLRVSGDYSYGIYLSAYPIEQSLVQLRPGMPWWVIFLGAMAAGTGFAALLWHFVERPVLARRGKLATIWRRRHPQARPGAITSPTGR